MNIIHEPLRYAHEEGYTDVCYSEDGEHFITCGADGDIRIWSVQEGEDPNHTCIGEWALSVRQKDDKIYVATGNNEIQILSHPEGERNKVLTRAASPFNQIALCKNENIAALAGEGMTIDIMDLDTHTLKLAFRDLEGPCLSVALCPNATKVAASCGDGKLRVWDLTTEALLKEQACFPKVNSFANAKHLCRLDFEPTNGAYLAYPDKQTIKLLDTSNWSEETLTCAQVKGEYSVLQYSFCGKYLAAATLEGDFVIWETQLKTVYKVSKHESSKAICALMWNPKGNGEIVYTDVDGQLSIMSHCSRLQRVDDTTIEEKIDENGFTENEVDFGDFIEEDAKVEDDVQLEDFTNDANSRSESRARSSSVTSLHSIVRPRTPTVALQPPFMPTSSPEHLDPRYLCWNDVGIVKSYGNNAGDETDSKSIEVEFHDSTFHNSMMLQNFQDYSMGSISKGALVVANLSQMMVIPLAASKKEWTLKVEEYEEIVLVAASENLICFATSNYLVRICSIFGTQRGLVSIPGPLVSMSAFKNMILVAYHAAGARDKDQVINMKLFKFEGFSVESVDTGSALGPDSTLYWLGFSDVGTPGMMDSLGMISLFPPKSNTWIPFCDTTKHNKNPGDHFFVTAVFESCQALGGIRCKGTVYPGFVPRPTMSELPIEPPFAESATDKTQMEMNMFVWSNLNVVDTEKKYKETALKIFALACKNDLDQRAFELMELVNNQAVLNLGLKYSTKLNKKRLAEKLVELASVLQADSDSGNSKINKTSVSESHEADRTIIKPKPTRLSLTKSSQKNKISKIETSGNIENTEDIPSRGNENNLSAINTEESLFSETESFVETPPPKNPFLKKVDRKLTEKSNDSAPQTTPSSNPFLRIAKKASQVNPLSLTDKYAGVNIESKTATEAGEKRKLSDTDAEKPAEKQRKLDMFMISKR